MQPLERLATTSSGLSNLPSILSYPKILSLDDLRSEIANQFVYVIRAYVEQGLAVVIKRESDQVFLVIGDWDGNPIPLAEGSHPLREMAISFVQRESPKFVEMMRILGIPQAMFYISAISDTDWKLVDLRVSLNNFHGPGMIRDIFSKVFPTQEVLKTVVLNPDVLDAIQRNEGTYSGELILKCSKFKTVQRNTELLPLYARVHRGRRGGL